MAKIKNILKKEMVKKIITNLIYSILIIIYCVVLNTQTDLLGQTLLIKYINISSLTFLAIAIIMLEVGYRKDKTNIFINGIEFIIFAISILLIKQMPKTFECTMKDYTEIITYIFVAYYIVKTGVQYTIKKHKQLKDLSDINEIVKEEPTKKASKRKNIKIEEGK